MSDSEKMKKTNEKGMVMAEAAVYLPLVILLILALVYLAFFKMQEYLLMYEAQRLSAIVTRETAYPGYDAFGMGEDNQIEFSWENIEDIPEASVERYYSSRHEQLKDMYREIGNLFSMFRSGSGGNYDSIRDEVAKVSLINLGTISTPRVSVNTGLFGSGVEVTFEHELPTPGAFQYLGFSKDGLTLKSTAYSYAVNPVTFVRDVNLAEDLINFVFEKLGCADKWKTFTEKTTKVFEKIF